MGISLGWLFWLFLKTRGGEKNQPPAQSPDAATPKQTEEEVDHLFEVSVRWPLGSVLCSPRQGFLLSQARRSAGKEEEPAVPGQGSPRPPAQGRGLRCHCSAWDETPSEVIAGASLGPAGAKGDKWAETERRGALVLTSFQQLGSFLYRNCHHCPPSSLPYRYQYESLNYTLFTKTWNRLLP